MSARGKNSLNRQVRRAYRQDELARTLTMPEADFGRTFGMDTVEVAQRGWRAPAGAPNDYYHFKDNGARVLAVAHLDTVVDPDRRTPHFYGTQSGPGITCGALDDRLGAYVITRLLPRLGVTHDWLLTTGEESCSSTASFFESPGKDYDHVIEFDRMGTDVVMYQYDDAATRSLVRAAGANVGEGSYSDIGSLEQLGVKAFNWGVGYRGNYHSEKGYAFLNDTFAMVAKYIRFNAQNAGIALPHQASAYSRHGSYRSGSYSSGSYSSGSYNWDDDCEFCLAYRAVDYETRYCGVCDTCADCYETRDDCQCWLPKYLRQKDRKQDREGGGWLERYKQQEDREKADWQVRAETLRQERAELDDSTGKYLQWLREHGLDKDHGLEDREPTQAELDEIAAEQDKEGEAVYLAELVDDDEVA